MVLEKLRGRSARELWVRGRQQLRIVGERVGIRADTWRRPPDIAAAFGVPTHRGPFLEGARSYVGDRWPSHVDATVGAALSVRAGRFDLLGYRGISFGTPLDWHLDPVRGKRAPLRHWSRVRFLDPSIAGDHKLIWELNRQQYLVTLARAFWLTGERDHAELARDHMRQWVAANPPTIGINWASSLEVALRAISWIWTYRLLEPADLWDAADRGWIARTLFLHGRHIENNLSTFFSPNTHLTGEALGLLYLGSVLDGPVGARWRRLGRRILEDELRRQVREDGSHFENSACYHRYTTDFYLHMALLLRALGDDADDTVLARLEDMADHLAWMTLPDGTTPLIGDDDGGRLLPLDDRPHGDYRDTVALAGAVLRNGRFKAVAGEPGPALYWLTGPEGVEVYEGLDATPPERGSRSFTAGPVVIMRDGWGSSASALVVEGGVASAGSMAHGHASALSIVLAVRGQTCFVDPGTFSYLPPERDRFRSTQVHSTVVIDGRSVPAPSGMFSWEHRPPVTLDRWVTGSGVDYACLTHHSSPPHRRDILFFRGDHWLMLDWVGGDEALPCELRFQLVPGASAQISGRRASITCGSQTVFMTFAGEGVPSASAAAVSPCYGRQTEAEAVSFPFESGQAILTAIVPAGAGVEPAEVRWAVDGEAAEYWIRRGTRTEYLVRSTGSGGLRTSRVRSDGDLAWLGWNDSLEAREPLQVFAPSRGLEVVMGDRAVPVSAAAGHVEGSVVDGKFEEAR